MPNKDDYWKILSGMWNFPNDTGIDAIGISKSGQNEQSKFEQIVILLVTILTIVFWILRNTEEFSFLAPMGQVFL